MNKEQKTVFFKEWVAALRSGKYKQGTLWLCNANDEYCCLGIAAKILGAKKFKMGAASHYYFSDEEAISAQIITTIFPGVISEKYEQTLAAMNDSMECSFDQIADYIEAEIIPFYEKENI